MRRSPSVLASISLVNRLTSVDAKPLSAGEYWSLLDRVPDPATLVGATVDDVAVVLGDAVDAERVARLIDAGTSLAVELERLETSGISVITPFDEDWPQRLQARLGATAPALLFVAGPVELLGADGLGIVGSRDVGEAGAEVARAAAGLAARQGMPVVSGGARGVDQLSMAASLAAGGTSIGILADSLAKTLHNADTRRAVLEGEACLATPYKPTAGFSAAGAMGRNKIVYALSRLTLVVASDRDKGGTWAGATEALRRNFGRVAVWIGEGEGPGNAALATKGAEAVSSIDELGPLLEKGPVEPQPAVDVVQQTLGL